MAFLEVEHLKYRYPHAKSWRWMIFLLRQKGEFIGIIGGKRCREKHAQARHFAGWFRSSIRALTAVK